ncbi:BadF/BadG/BcrA/BcrD ATPase family protein [Bacillus gobiensis]|uniref:N-acetylglucosamine kinase n=1 Tax=Bacillus gobiensis TaxID=1441095 RepID=UPI003D22DB5F
MSKLLLAVDGGATKTIAVITDAKGAILGRGKAGSSNYQVVGELGAVQALTKSIQEALDESGLNEKSLTRIDKAVFALAGIDTSMDERTVKGFVRKAVQQLSLTIPELIIENDCQSALLGVTQDKPGVLLIAGTGSIAFAHDGRGTFVRAGGWGHRVGDEGSGYWIGKEAIRSVLKMLDGREKNTILARLILEHFQFASIEDLYNWVYSEDYTVDDVSALTQSVEKARELGDEVSKSILDSAAEELGQLLLTVIQKTDIVNDEFDLILQGGVLQHNQYIREKVKLRIKEQAEQVKVVTAKEEPIFYIINRGLAISE